MMNREVQLTKEQDELWESAFGLHYPYGVRGREGYSTPGYAGTALLKRLAGAQYGPTWLGMNVLPAWHNVERDIQKTDWFTDIDEDEPHTYWDMSVAYLRAMSRAHFPVKWIRKNEHPIELDDDDGGLFLIAVPEWEYWDLLPHPVSYANKPSTCHAERWVSTPTLNLLWDLWQHGKMDAPKILEAWTSTSRPLMAHWANLMHSVYSNEQFLPIQDLVKASFRETFGSFGRDTVGGIYRPDWRAIIMGENYTRLWKICWEIGNKTDIWPSYMHVDAIVYPGYEFPFPKYASLFRAKEMK